MKMLAFASFSLLLLGRGNALCSTEEAVRDQEYPYKEYGWSTVYDTVRGNVSILGNRAPPGCTPIHIVLVARHGSRFPGANLASVFEGYEELSKNLNTTGNAELCPEDMKKIENWTNWFNPENDTDLSSVGVNEMKGIARRFTDLLPDLLSNAGARADKFRFAVTKYARTRQSAEAFAEELFKDNASAYANIELKKRLMTYNYQCQKYLVEVAQNLSVLEEAKKFDAGPHMKQVAEGFADNLGLPRGQFDVDYVDRLIFAACASQEVSTGTHSPWCLAFSSDDIKASEYRQDIQSYTMHSHGHEISYEQACELKYYVLSSLKNASLEESPYLGEFGFGHGPTIVTLLTLMKLIKDEGILKADDYEERANRSFRISHLSPEAGNIAFVLYKCGVPEEMKIQIFLNEKVIKMPLGDPAADDLWDLDDALNYYDFDDGMCNWDDICSVKSMQATATTTTTPTATETAATTLSIGPGGVTSVYKTTDAATKKFPNAPITSAMMLLCVFIQQSL